MGLVLSVASLLSQLEVLSSNLTIAIRRKVYCYVRASRVLMYLMRILFTSRHALSGEMMTEEELYPPFHLQYLSQTKTSHR